MKTLSVSASQLAAEVFRQGDLYPGIDGRTTAEEGIRTQQQIQQQRKLTDPGYETEVGVAQLVGYNGMRLQVQGRIDGMQQMHKDAATLAQTWLVEEYKTTRAAAELAHATYAAEHWAQVTVYAALLAIANPERHDWQLRLVYCHPESHAQWHTQRDMNRRELLVWFHAAIAQYIDRRQQHIAYQQARDTWVHARQFPFDEFRPGQRALAATVYQSVAARAPVLLEAPTGSGKSLGVLFPAAKALLDGDPPIQRYLYLTARTSGALAAQQALELMAESGRGLRSVHVRAKRAVCPVPGMPCHAQRCEYAKGYYDRIKPAVADLLARSSMSVPVTAEVAQTHKVCPFELSLDAALWSDVVIMDYNYVFDPVARLLRFADGVGSALLIDEAHQLFPRACDMLSMTLQREWVRRAIAEAPPQVFLRRLRAVDRALLACSKDVRTESAYSGNAEGLIEYPNTLDRSLQRLQETLAEHELDLNEWPELRELIFNVIRWRRLAEDFDSQRYVALAQIVNKALSLRVVCLDSTPHLRRILDRFECDVRFSGTLSPLPLYARLHGRDSGRAERTGSPFAPAQLCTLIVRDVPTYYRQREQSLPKLIQLLDTVLQAKPGRYLVALPSFAYLRLVKAAWLAAFPQLDTRSLLAQEPGMDSAAQAQFLADFRSTTTALALVVLGGSFAESVDFSDTRIDGVICVGVGIAPPDLINQQRKIYFQAQQMDGEQITARQPAMVKVVQMAGRLLRSPSDRGVLCLVDDRFLRRDYAEFYPQLWDPLSLRLRELAPALAEFWSED